MDGNPTAPAPDAGRRTVVSWLLGGGVAASLASFFYPVTRFLVPPRVAEVAVKEVDAGQVQDLKPNSGKIVKFGNKPALLVGVNDTEWKAFSAVCTHLSCTVQYRVAPRNLVRLPQRHLRPRGQGGLRTAAQTARRDGGENPRRRSRHFKTRVTGGIFTCHRGADAKGRRVRAPRERLPPHRTRRFRAAHRHRNPGDPIVTAANGERYLTVLK